MFGIQIYFLIRPPVSLIAGFAGAVVILSASEVHAQDEDIFQSELISENEFFDELPSFSTATRLPTPKADTPAAMTIIDREMIQASGARELADLLRLVPGFQVAAPRAHRPAATYHGLGDQFSRRMQILIDGRSVYGALLGHVSWSSQGVAIEDIERIEVVRGPNSVAYGANAFLGTINIITGHSSQQRKASLKLTAGQGSVADALLSAGSAFSNGSIRGTAAYKSDRGLAQVFDNSQIRSASLRVDIEPTDKDVWLLQASTTNTDQGEGNAGSFITPEYLSDVVAHFGQLRWQHRFSDENNLSVQVYHNYRKLYFDYLTETANIGPPFGEIQLNIEDSAVAERSDIEIQHNLSPSENLRFVWGLGARQDKVTSDGYFAENGSAEVSSSRIFGNAEWRATEKAIINAGVMWEDSDFVSDSLSPRLAVNYQLASRQTIRLVASEAIRTASLFEELGDIRFDLNGFTLDQTIDSQGNLDAEKMRSYELGYFGQFYSLDTTLDVRVYQDDIDDLISPVLVASSDLNDGVARSYSNQGGIKISGIDMEVRFRPTRKTLVAFTSAYMTASADAIAINSIVTQEEREDSVPRYSGSLFFMHELTDDWTISGIYSWVDEMLWLDSSNISESYTRLDVRLAKGFRLDNTRGEIALQIQNFGDDYAEYFDDQFFERRVILSTSIQF